MKVSKVVVPLMPKDGSAKSVKKQISFKAETETYLNETQGDTLMLQEENKSKKQLSKGAIATITTGAVLGVVAVAVPSTAAILRKNKWKDVDLNNKELGGFKKGMCKLGDSINNGLSKLFGKAKDQKVSETAKNAAQVQNSTSQTASNNMPSLTIEDVKNVVDEGMQNITNSIQTVSREEMKQLVQDGLKISIAKGISKIISVITDKINEAINIAKDDLAKDNLEQTGKILEAINITKDDLAKANLEQTGKINEAINITKDDLAKANLEQTDKINEAINIAKDDLAKANLEQTDKINEAINIAKDDLAKDNLEQTGKINEAINITRNDL